MIYGFSSASDLYPNMLSSVILFTGVPMILDIGISCRTLKAGGTSESWIFTCEASVNLVGVDPRLSTNAADPLLFS